MATLKKAIYVEQKLRDMGLKSAVDLYRKGVAETLTYLDFPHEHWRSIRTNNILERLNCEICRRTRVEGCFLDGESSLMLICVRLRYVATKEWDAKRFLNMKHLYELEKLQEYEKEMKKGEDGCSLDLMLEQTIFAKDP